MREREKESKRKREREKKKRIQTYAIQLSTEAISASDEIKVDSNDEKPDIGQYWEISNCSASFDAVVMEKTPVYGPLS